MKTGYLLLALVAWTTGQSALAADNGGKLVWFDGQHPVSYTVKGRVAPVVSTALDMLGGDLQQVTGMRPVAATDGTIVVMPSGKGSDDGFRLYVSDGHIVVRGHSDRGTAYGLLELSRLAGVSPWVWWGDVVPERRSRLELAADYDREHTPSVAFRGVFLNDEDWSLRPWSSTTYEPGVKGQIGPKTYRRLFELLLRLRANTVWPAMHEGTVAFFQTPRAKQVADSFGIVVGTSHCEPLLRNNVGEWDTGQRGRFNYKTNREAVQQYWVERLREVKGSSGNFFTIGMRGIHDSSMEGYTTDADKLQGLQQVIDDQQRLLRRYVGEPRRLPQMFAPYKEVLQLYEMGLQVPDYVTLVWCDDNYGYMTRYSTPDEQRRQGGAGVYYHLSYWGRPHDYLWLTTTQPGLIYNELREAYDHEVRRLWVANVHDPKVAGYDLELFLDLAWDIKRLSPNPSLGERGAITLEGHLEGWLCRQFGDEAGRRLLPAMREFYRLCGERRPEFTGWTQVELDKRKYDRGLSPVTTVGWDAFEAAHRVADFERLKAAVRECKPYVRAELADAFFAAIEYPVLAAAAMNRKILGDSAESHWAYEEIQALTAHYNQLGGGKWRGLMDAAPRRLPVFTDVHAQTAAQRPRPAVERNACDYDGVTPGAQTVQMLGRSMNAVRLPKGGALTYDLTVSQAGDYTLTTALIPTHPVDGGDLRFSVSVDGAEPTVFSLKEPFRSEPWKLNVLSGQALRHLKVHLAAGRHRLVIRALDEHVVVDRIMLTH